MPEHFPCEADLAALITLHLGVCWVVTIKVSMAMLHMQHRYGWCLLYDIM